jgi:hypothetical protein
MHGSSQRVLQQTPFRQKPDAQSWSDVHGISIRGVPQWLPVQKAGSRQSESAVQTMRHWTPSEAHRYGEQSRVAGTTQRP